MAVFRYDRTVSAQFLDWQSKLILLLVVPCTAVSLVFEAREFAANQPAVMGWALGLSVLLGLLAWFSRAGTPAA